MGVSWRMIQSQPESHHPLLQPSLLHLLGSVVEFNIKHKDGRHASVGHKEIVNFQTSSWQWHIWIQFSSVHWLIGSHGEHEGHSAEILFQAFSARSHPEQFWHKQRHPLFDVAHQAYNFFCQPWCCPSPNVLWKMVLGNLSWCVTCLKFNHVCFHPE